MSFTATPYPADPKRFRVVTEDERDFDISVAVDESEIPALVDFHLNPPPYVVPEAPAPAITARQLRLWLVRNGYTLAQVEAVIDGLPEPARTEAKIEWEFASEFQPGHPTLLAVAAALGIADIAQAASEAALI
jgi:hypothetical protein